MTSAERGDPELDRRVRWRFGIKYLPVNMESLWDRQMGAYFVGARIGIAGTEGMKCSEIALASCVDRVERFEVLIAGYA